MSENQEVKNPNPFIGGTRQAKKATAKELQAKLDKYQSEIDVIERRGARLAYPDGKLKSWEYKNIVIEFRMFGVTVRAYNQDHFYATGTHIYTLLSLYVDIKREQVSIISDEETKKILTQAGELYIQTLCLLPSCVAFINENGKDNFHTCIPELVTPLTDFIHEMGRLGEQATPPTSAEEEVAKEMNLVATTLEDMAKEQLSKDKDNNG